MSLADLLTQPPQTGPRYFTLDQQRDLAKLAIDMAAWMGSGYLNVHEFVGRHDRDCEACHGPDRHPAHTAYPILARFAALDQRVTT